MTQRFDIGGDAGDAGAEMYALIKQLYPICRSITGNGVRQTLEIIKEHIPVEIHEIPSGTEVFDWKVPKEWNIKDAYVKNPNGEKILDFKKNNIHVVSYSAPVKKKISLEELKGHLYSLPDHRQWIPYRTSYYKENWGFCISQEQLEKLEPGEYEVFIDSTLEDGSLSYGELLIRGKSDCEVLFSTYICHPSLCNDNLTGPAIITYLAKMLMGSQPRYSYRFILIPETIGAIVWLSRNENNVKKIKCGLVATCLGDRGCLTYKKTRRGDADIDKIAERVLAETEKKTEMVDFFPLGSDERQFCSPGFDLPIGSLMRTPYGKFNEYHTSADDLEFISADSLKDSLERYADVVYILENNEKYLNSNPKCEPNLGKRGLYEMVGGEKGININQTAILWVLNLSDGNNSLLDIAAKSGMKFRVIKEAADRLSQVGLLKKLE